MYSITEGFKQAWRLLGSFDAELWQIIANSFMVSLSATLLAALLAVPLGAWLSRVSFRGKPLVGRVLYTMMSLPTVVLGLLVFLILSRNGPLGFLGLMYTKRAMMIAQFLLITPLITALVWSVCEKQGTEIAETAKTLGAGRLKQTVIIVRELRAPITSQVMTGFSRAISEVGAVMIVGGNIRYQTRVMTTSISMMNSMGQYAQAIALGIVLLSISLVLNSLVYTLRGGE